MGAFERSPDQTLNNEKAMLSEAGLDLDDCKNRRRARYCEDRAPGPPSLALRVEGSGFRVQGLGLRVL